MIIFKEAIPKTVVDPKSAFGEILRLEVPKRAIYEALLFVAIMSTLLSFQSTSVTSSGPHFLTLATSFAEEAQLLSKENGDGGCDGSELRCDVQSPFKSE